MTIVLTALTLTLIVVPVTLLAIVRAGIRRDERCASLNSQPPTLSAALARRLLGLYAANGAGAHPPAASHGRPLARDGKGACSS